MSSYLWKYYLEDDVERFRHLLETAGYNVKGHTQKGGGAGQITGGGAVVGSPATMGTSPTITSKSRKASGFGQSGTPLTNHGATTLTRADLNWRDNSGLTILHHAASSTAEDAMDFAQALLDHPLTDLYLQDLENGWTALHRAFYFGNITIARAILERDAENALGHGGTGVVQRSVGLIKIKDREGHGPLDLYAATIKDRTLRPESEGRPRAGSITGSEDERNGIDHTGGDEEEERRGSLIATHNIGGDELYTFGSNRNITLGFGNEDDRQFPERIALKRPEHLLQRFYREYLVDYEKTWGPFDQSVIEAPHSNLANSLPIDSIPWAIRTKPIIIQDVHMSKLHTAVLTTDPESNLYMCGHGPGGRLGTGDERTRFNLVCIEGGALTGRKVATVALGQNHSLALSEEGEIFSWGNNGFGQLGYTLPKTSRDDEDPIQTSPRQIFGPLKRELVIGVAASRIHSVAHTSSSLYTFGKNEGQLGIVDSDARSLETQVIPRKVAASLFSHAISSVAAADKATICLLENHDVWVFANYGYTKVQFPLNGFSNHFLKQSFLLTKYDTTANHICKVTSGGDTICALSSSGEIYTLSVSQRPDMQQSSASTTNPSKIKGALSPPQRIWSLKTNNMAARDVGVDADGSIILSTEEGSVWKRSRRAKMKDTAVVGTAEYKPKDYKFSRISGLTRVTAVRASAYGSYAAVRKDCDVTRTQTAVEDQTLWEDMFALLSFNELQGEGAVEDSETEEPVPRFWQSRKTPDGLALLRKHLLESKDPEQDLDELLKGESTAGYDVLVGSTISDIRIPAHQLVLAGRSRVLRQGLNQLRKGGDFTVPELLSGAIDSQGTITLLLQGLDVLTLLNFVLYCYVDSVVDYWHYIRQSPKNAFRYRQIRTELMKMASKLDLHHLEPAVRQMVEPSRTLNMDLDTALKDHLFLTNGDIKVQLADEDVLVHRALVCQRCPFFEGLFMGRAGGRWLEERLGQLNQPSEAVAVDLKHIEFRVFQIVLRHIYADTGEELFDDIISADVDEFLDVVMEVMSVANELMLDRLSQICQKVVGRYVNARNVCGLLNAIAPSSVTEFKDAALEYMCLNLEAMLQGGLLDELDEDLLLELDGIVRDNQLASMPYAKSGRAEALLHERHPELAELLDRDRQAKIDAIQLHDKYHDPEIWAPGSFRAFSYDDHAHDSPSQSKARRKSSKILASPALKGKEPIRDNNTDLDGELSELGQSLPRGAAFQLPRSARNDVAVGTPPDAWFDSRGKPFSPQLGPMKDVKTAQSPIPRSPSLTPSAVPPSTPGGAPWAASPSPGGKLGMKDIMAQASSSRVSNLSLGIAASRSQPTPDAPPVAPAAPKMSQKERKKMMQAQAEAEAAAQKPDKASSPWQIASSTKVPSLKDVLDTPKQGSRGGSPRPSPSRTPSTPQLTMRQTIANPKPAASPKNVIGPAGQAQLPQRSVSGSAGPKPVVASPSQPARPSPTPRQVSGMASTISPKPPPNIASSDAFPTIQSVRHQPRPVEPSLQLSMADIVAQQQLEKDIIKEAAAARSLQDIQAEQEFQEWWDKETARMKEQEELEQGQGSRNAGVKRGKSRGPRGGGGRGRGGPAKSSGAKEGSAVKAGRGGAVPATSGSRGSRS